MIIDMIEVFTAFALNYPSKAKKKADLFDWHYKDWDFHNSHYGEYIEGKNLIGYQISQNDGMYIQDVYHKEYGNVTENWGDIIAIRSTLPESFNGAVWIPSIPVVRCKIDVSTTTAVVGTSLTRPITAVDIKMTGITPMTWGYKIADINEFDFGGDIGVRWYIVIRSLFGVKESYGYDLGPEKNKFEPKFGLLVYSHSHDTGEWALEIYNTIVDFEAPKYPLPHLLPV
jgi:hypothetical protein